MKDSRTVSGFLRTHRDSGSSKVVLQLGVAAVGVAMLVLFQDQLGPVKEMLLQRQTRNISEEFIYGESADGETGHVHDFVYLSEGRHWCHCGVIQPCRDGSDPDEACDICGQVMTAG